MKKILSIFALVLCAITLPLGLVGCKKENGPEYVVGRTYTFSSVEYSSDFGNETLFTEMLKGTAFSFSKTVITSYDTENNITEKYFYKINNDYTISVYNDASLNDTDLNNWDKSNYLKFSKDYTKLYFIRLTDEGVENNDPTKFEFKATFVVKK